MRLSPGVLAVVASAAACTHRAHVCGVVPPPAAAMMAATPAPAPVPAKPPSIWPVPVRVMTWTPDGITQLGVLPDAPPAQPPTMPWFVEPTRPLDEATLRALVVAVRTEHVPGLSLRGQQVAAWADALADLPELHALILDDSDIADPAALHVSLQRIYLTRTPIDDAAITRLVAAQPALEVLAVEECAVTDKAIPAIGKLASLRALDLAGTRITDAGGAQLGALAHLQILDLGRTAVGAKTIAAIRPLALRELFLDATRVGHELATLDGYAPGLVRLDVSLLDGYKPTDADLAWLANAPNLVELGLSGARVHDDLVLRLLALPKLRDVRLASTPITNAAIQAMTKLTDLEQVDLAETPVDNASAAALLALPKLRMLRLDQTPIDDAALHVVPGPALEELYLTRTNIGDDGAQILDALPKLVALGLGETGIGDATLARIARLTKLHTLVLSAARANRTSLAALGALTELERLYLDQTRADDTTLEALVGLHALRILHLNGTEVSDASLDVLHAFHDLEELAIGDTRVGSGISDLGAWPHLRTLSLLGLGLDDAALAPLAKRTSLVALDMSSTEITNPAPLAVLPRLRVLGVVDTKLSAEGSAAVAALAARKVLIVR